MVRSSGIYVHTHDLVLFPGELGPTSVDLSKATRLKDIIFWINSLGPEWVTAALRTVTPNHRDLRQISISEAHLSILTGYYYDTEVQLVEEQALGQWLELDRVLAQLRESHSVSLKVVCPALLEKEKSVRDLMGRLLPEATRGGTVILFDDAW